MFKTNTYGESCNQQFAYTEIQNPTVQVFTTALNNIDEVTTSISCSTIVNDADTSDLLCIDLRLNEIRSENKILIYPNPATKIIRILTNIKLTHLILQVVNTFGTIVMTNQIEDLNTEEINIETLSSGLYYVRVFDAKNQFTLLLVVRWMIL